MESFKNDFESNNEILLLLLNFREIKKQIISQGENEVNIAALQKDLESVDVQMSKVVAEWNGYTLEKKVKTSGLILKLIENICKTKHQENIYSRLVKFQNSFHEFVTNNKNDLISYSGIFSTLPIEVMVLVISRMERKDYINVTSTCCWLLSMRMEIIKNPETMLEVFSRIPVPYKLSFIEHYFRPVSGELYQNLKNLALQKSCFKTYLSYSVVTNNINDLDADYLNDMYKWLEKHDKKLYLQFNNTLFAIYGVLKNNKKIFLYGCPRRNLSNISNDFNYPPKNFINLAGAKFPSDFFNGTELLEMGYYRRDARAIDLRFANLENTLWQSLKIEFVFLRHTNLSNSIMDKITVSDDNGSLDLRHADCRHITIREVGIKYSYSRRIILMNSTNFEGAGFEKIPGKMTFGKKCNLTNTDFSKTDIDGITIESEVDSNGMKLLSPAHITNTDLLAEKLNQFNIERLHKISWFDSDEDKAKLASFRQITIILAKNICDMVNASSLDDTKKLEILEFAANHDAFNPIEKFTLNFFDNKSDAIKILQTALYSLNPKSETEQQHVLK